VSANGSFGSLQIVDALRDIRSNVENTIPTFQISGYSAGLPTTIFNFPSELRGYVYSSNDGNLANIDYSTEASKGPVGSFQSGTSSIAIPPTFGHFYGAESNAGILEIVDASGAGPYLLNIPNRPCFPSIARCPCPAATIGPTACTSHWTARRRIS
jgi:hypothetical protein